MGFFKKNNKTKKYRSASMADYVNDMSGNFAVTLAVIVAVLLGGVGLAVDVSKAYSAKSRLQDTTDAIALLAAKDTKKNQKQLNRAAKDYVLMTYGKDITRRIDIQNVKREGDSVTVVAQHNIDTYFGGLFGFKTVDVSTLSTAIYANGAVNISMVLDTTFSMNGTKLDVLKDAANSLVDTVDALDNDKIRLSVVPFAQYVNVGLSRRNAIWLDVPADYTEPGGETCYMTRDVLSKSNCRTENRNCENDGVSYDCSREVCDYDFGPEYEVCGVANDTDYTWNGCVGSRDAPYHLDVAYNGRKIPGLLNSRCGAEVQPLTDNFTDVKDTIDNMVAQGETYMPSGLMWGWRMLDKKRPFDEAANVQSGVTRTSNVLILMTDGNNTKSRNGQYHSGADADDADKTTATLCESIKDSDIVVYTIAYEVNDRDTKSLLQNCASNKKNYFNAKNAKALKNAFEKIGTSLSELRVTA